VGWEQQPWGKPQLQGRAHKQAQVGMKDHVHVNDLKKLQISQDT
jgi:hypothetical protein